MSPHEQAGWYLLLHHTPERVATRPYDEIIGPLLSRPAALRHARREGHGMAR